MSESISKKSIVVIVSIAAVIVVTAIGIYGLQDNIGDDRVITNENVLSSGFFDVIYEPTVTHTEGSYFIMEDEGDLKMKIIAKVTVGPKDFGGISFNFIDGFKVTGITCDFGDGLISDHVALWTTADRDPGRDIISFVQIEKGIGTQPVGGGTGMIEIELEVKQGMEEPYFIIGAGSRISEAGTVIIDPVSEKIFVEVD